MQRWYRVYAGAVGLLLLIVLVACAEAEENGTGDDVGDPGGAPTATPDETDVDTATPDDSDDEATATPDDSGDAAGGLSWDLIATEKTLPAGLVEPTVELAESQEQYEQLWNEFGLEDDAPTVDWDERVVIFAGTGESGTCPLELLGVEHEAEERLLTLDVSVDTENDTPCTDDWTPRSFVVTVDAGVAGGDELTVSIYDSGYGPGEIHREDVMAQSSWYELLATEKTYPEAEVGEKVLELAEDEGRFDELWDWFGVEEAERPEIDWNSDLVLFAGTGESSGCPLVLDGMSFDQEERFIEISVSRDVPADTVCTADWTPRMFVIALDAAYLGDGELRAAIGQRRDGEHEFEADDGVVIREQ